MKGKFNREVNNRLLFRLVQLFMELERLSKETPEKINSGKVSGVLEDTRLCMGSDISNYVVNNIFAAPQAKDLVYPKFQFSHSELQFQFILN